MKIVSNILAGLFTVAVVLSLIGAQPALATTTVNVGSVVTQPLSGGITIAFNKQTAPPSNYLCKLLIDANVANGAYCGDLSGFAGLTFRIRCDSAVEPQGVSVMMTCRQPGSRKTSVWNYQAIATSANRDAWMLNGIPLAPNAGWVNYAGGNWTVDIKAVESITISLSPSTTGDAQSFTVDGLALKTSSSFVAGSTSLSAGQAALWDFFGVTDASLLTDAQKKQSTLVSGLADVDVLLALNDAAHYAENVFKAAAAEGGTGITVGWYALEGKTYRILRSSDLTAGFTEVGQKTANGFTGIGYISYEDTGATGVGPYFYKIVMAE